MKILDIAEVSQKTGLRPSTLRYYEEIGLIASVRRHGLRRQFDPEVLLKLSLIALGKSADFSLDEISTMFGEKNEPNLPRPDLHAKADALEVQIRNLTTLKNALRHVADCSAPSHLECPKFQQLLKVAARYKPKQKRAEK